jgi:carboxymethylenebutenolidase
LPGYGLAVWEPPDLCSSYFLGHFHGTADEEVSPRRCGELVERSKTEGGAIEIRFYTGASHSFDDPGAKRQSNEANAVATEDAVQRSLRFFADQLRL